MELCGSATTASFRRLRDRESLCGAERDMAPSASVPTGVASQVTGGSAPKKREKLTKKKSVQRVVRLNHSKADACSCPA